MVHPQLNEIFSALAATNPTPETELIYTNSYTLLIAVVLSAQATDKGVNKATKALFKVASTPAEMVTLGEEKLKDYIKTIGLFNSKAKNIIALSHQLLTLHEGAVPSNRAALEALPGVGRKTANVILNVCFGHPTIAVDTHIFRVSRRIGLSQGTTPLKVEQDLCATIPAHWQKYAHHWLILLGRYTCQARKPQCYRCPVQLFCHYPEKKLHP